MLGWMHEHGEGVPACLDEAIRLYRAAAERGSAPAHCELGHADCHRRLGWLHEHGWASLGQ